MEKLVLYKVTKSSSNGEIKFGDLVWISENGDLNTVMGRGWLLESEWNIEGTNDFEYEICKTHYLDVTKGRECARKLS